MSYIFLVKSLKLSNNISETVTKYEKETLELVRTRLLLELAQAQGMALVRQTALLRIFCGLVGLTGKDGP